MDKSLIRHEDHFPLLVYHRPVINGSMISLLLESLEVKGANNDEK